MSDSTLLAFGCAVSFIAAAGMYVYLRECFTRADRARDDRRDEVARALRINYKPHVVEAVPVERPVARVRDEKRDRAISA